MNQYKICPLCGNREINNFITCTDFLVTGEKFEIYSCAGCLGAFTMGHPSEEEAGRYYKSENYISHTDSSRNLFEKIYQLVRKVFLARKRNLVKKLTGLKTGSILDIGCGTGHFVNTMKLAGWKVTGIEIDENARKYAKERFSADVFPPDYVTALSPESFDAVTLWHVLEHFDNPANWMKEISGILKPGGLAFVALPNSNSSDAGYYKETWAAWDVPRHIWHFNPHSFRIFTANNGFEIIKELPMPADVFYISVLSEKIRNTRLPFLTGLMKGLWLSISAGSGPERSSSVLYVIRKKIR
jgi:SAM-dependent methyltransferase